MLFRSGGYRRQRALGQAEVRRQTAVAGLVMKQALALAHAELHAKSSLRTVDAGQGSVPLAARQWTSWDVDLGGYHLSAIMRRPCSEALTGAGVRFQAAVEAAVKFAVRHPLGGASEQGLLIMAERWYPPRSTPRMSTALQVKAPNPARRQLSWPTIWRAAQRAPVPALAS